VIILYIINYKIIKLSQVCVVELGGTIGDIESMPFVEAFRQFQFKVKKENFVCAHVSFILQVNTKFIFILLLFYAFKLLYVSFIAWCDWR